MAIALEDEPRVTVSVYLLKMAQEAQALAALRADRDAEYQLDVPDVDGMLLTFPLNPDPPKWLEYLLPILADDASPPLVGQFPAALLWVAVAGRTFLISFGHGHAKIKDEWVEPEFGKIAALALVPQEQVKEVRAEQVFARRHIANERAPQASAVREFGFEPDRDLFAAVEGVPELQYQPAFGKKVRGGTAFKFDLAVGDLPNTLGSVLERFNSGDHRQRWPQANQLVLVRDSTLIIQLDAALDAILVGANPEQAVVLAAPAERSGDKPYPQRFVIGRLPKVPAYSLFLAFAGWQAHLAQGQIAPSVGAARETRVHLFDENEDKIGCCSMYACFGAEVALAGTQYVLSSGSWYAADQSFIANTATALAALAAAPPPHSLSAWGQNVDERTYNLAACRADLSLWHFDRTLVWFGGGQSRFEFCDIMHLPTQTLYFVKHAAGSAGVSHLCEQVRRTAELFFSPDAGFRTRLTQRIMQQRNGWSTAWLDSRPKRHEWNLCLVLMGTQLNDLPCFAKCGVARLLGELQKGGYQSHIPTTTRRRPAFHRSNRALPVPGLKGKYGRIPRARICARQQDCFLGGGV